MIAVAAIKIKKKKKNIIKNQRKNIQYIEPTYINPHTINEITHLYNNTNDNTTKE